MNKLWSNTRGQDLIEYALMAGFVAAAAVAIIPGTADPISAVATKIGAGTLTIPVVRILSAVLMVGFLLVIVLRRKWQEDRY